MTCETLIASSCINYLSPLSTNLLFSRTSFIVLSLAFPLQLCHSLLRITFALAGCLQAAYLRDESTGRATPGSRVADLVSDACAITESCPAGPGRDAPGPVATGWSEPGSVALPAQVKVHECKQ